MGEDQSPNLFDNFDAFGNRHSPRYPHPRGWSEEFPAGNTQGQANPAPAATSQSSSNPLDAVDAWTLGGFRRPGDTSPPNRPPHPVGWDDEPSSRGRPAVPRGRGTFQSTRADRRGGFASWVPGCYGQTPPQQSAYAVPASAPQPPNGYYLPYCGAYPQVPTAPSSFRMTPSPFQPKTSLGPADLNPDIDVHIPRRYPSIPPNTIVGNLRNGLPSDAILSDGSVRVTRDWAQRMIGQGDLIRSTITGRVILAPSSGFRRHGANLGVPTLFIEWMSEENGVVGDEMVIPEVLARPFWRY